jgi:hypothetical protein
MNISKRLDILMYNNVYKSIYVVSILLVKVKFYSYFVKLKKNIV